MPPKTLCIASGICLTLCLALPAFGAKLRMEEVTTDHSDLAPGGLIHVENSSGELNIAGWDQPTVEIVATRYTFREDTPREKERTAVELKRIQVVKTLSNSGELTITTSGKRGRGINLDYQIMIPRDSRLVIRHRNGAVIVLNVGGDIDATAHIADILVQLPQPKHEVIDAKCTIGGIYSDFNSAGHHWAGSKLIQDSPTADPKAPSQRVGLRVGTGGISITKMETPPAEPVPTRAGL
jgi:hypothetical protein